MGKEYTPVLPFDGTMNDNFVIYDNTVYKCTVDSYQVPIKLHHDAMVKYYSCNYEEKPVRIGGD